MVFVDIRIKLISFVFLSSRMLIISNAFVACPVVQWIVRLTTTTEVAGSNITGSSCVYFCSFSDIFFFIFCEILTDFSCNQIQSKCAHVLVFFSFCISLHYAFFLILRTVDVCLSHDVLSGIGTRCFSAITAYLGNQSKMP